MGVATDKQTSYSARTMVISVIPFIIVQLPLIFKISSGRRVAVLVALIVAVIFLLAYCFYQVPGYCFFAVLILLFLTKKLRPLSDHL